MATRMEPGGGVDVARIFEDGERDLRVRWAEVFVQVPLEGAYGVGEGAVGSDMGERRLDED